MASLQGEVEAALIMEDGLKEERILIISRLERAFHCSKRELQL